MSSSSTSSTSRTERIQAMQKQQKKEEAVRKAIPIIIISAITLALIGTFGYIFYTGSKNEKNVVGKQLTPKNINDAGLFKIMPDGSVDTSKKKNAAPEKTMTIMIFDPQCPACSMVDEKINPKMTELNKKGETSLYISPVTFLNQASTDDYSQRAANAVITVAENDPQHFKSFVDYILNPNNQPKEGTEYVSTPDEKIAEMAVKSGVSQEAANKIKDRSYYDYVVTLTDKMGNDKNMFPEGLSTPATFVGGTIKDGKIEGAKKVEFMNPPENFLKQYVSAFETAKKQEGK